MRKGRYLPLNCISTQKMQRLLHILLVDLLWIYDSRVKLTASGVVQVVGNRV